ncbi:MAG: VanW family protein [Oscillospiraceae bacterium]
MKRRRLFCTISPLTYQISMQKEILKRKFKDLSSSEKFAFEKQKEPLPVRIYLHESLIRRKLGDVDMTLQENKAVNLSIAAPKIDGILIRPGQTFSFWRLVGKVSEKYGYKQGLTIANGKPDSDIGGGMCQFTNLIHYLILHSQLVITEHHHHDGVDLFPDFGRVIPFGTGTSIMYNYLDYRFKNETEHSFQLLVHTDEEYLWGELRSDVRSPFTYHIHAEDEFFSNEGGVVYRNNKIYRDTIDVRSGNKVLCELIKSNHARVLYSTENLIIR